MGSPLRSRLGLGFSHLASTSIPLQRRTPRTWHTGYMARGWESKSVEDQIEAAESRRAATLGRQLSAVEAERTQKREHLLLSRTRVLHDIEHANNPRYQEILRGALKHLDDKLLELE